MLEGELGYLCTNTSNKISRCKMIQWLSLQLCVDDNSAFENFTENVSCFFLNITIDSNTRR